MRPIVMKFTRGDDYKTIVVISEYDSMTYHATEVPEDAPPELVARFFEEAETAATKQLEKIYDSEGSVGWTEMESTHDRYYGGE